MARIAPEPSGRAVARLLAGGLEDPIRITVDLRRRDLARRVIASFDGCQDARVPQVADLVIAYGPGQRRGLPATVAGLDERTRVLLLEPIWHKGKEYRLMQPESPGAWPASRWPGSPSC